MVVLLVVLLLDVPQRLAADEYSVLLLVAGDRPVAADVVRVPYEWCFNSGNNHSSSRAPAIHKKTPGSVEIAMAYVLTRQAKSTMMITGTYGPCVNNCSIFSHISSFHFLFHQ